MRITPTWSVSVGAPSRIARALAFVFGQLIEPFGRGVERFVAFQLGGVGLASARTAEDQINRFAKASNKGEAEVDKAENPPVLRCVAFRELPG